MHLSDEKLKLVDTKTKEPKIIYKNKEGSLVITDRHKDNFFIETK